MSGHNGSRNGRVAPAAFPPPVDSQQEFIKRGLDAEDELIEVGVAIVGGGTAGLACANRLLQLLADDPETMERLGEVPGRGDREGQDVRWAQPLRRGHASGAAAGAVSRDDSRAVARGGVRVRRGDQGGGLPAAQRQDEAAASRRRRRSRTTATRWSRSPAMARYQQRQAEEAGAYILTETSATQLIVRTAAWSASARATRAAARTASRWVTSSPAPTSRRRRRCWPRAAGGI